MIVLDLAKCWMYQFWYSFLKKKYRDKIHLLFTDTDSFCFEVETDNVYADMEIDLDLNEMMDTSDFPTTHPLHSNKHKKVIGKFKDEMNGVPIEEFIGLRPKMYSVLASDKVEKRVAKGITRAAQRKLLRHETYKNALFNRKAEKIKMNRIQSILHRINTFSINKIGLSPADDKRFVLDDGITTLPYGHYWTQIEDRFQEEF